MGAKGVKFFAFPLHRFFGIFFLYIYPKELSSTVLSSLKNHFIVPDKKEEYLGKKKR